MWLYSYICWRIKIDYCPYQCIHEVLEKQPWPMRYILDGHVPFAGLVDNASHTTVAHALVVLIAPATEARHAPVSTQYHRQRNAIRNVSAVVALSVSARPSWNDYLMPDKAKSRWAKCLRVRASCNEIRRVWDLSWSVYLSRCDCFIYLAFCVRRL